jgi:hypothetical protein
MTVAAADLKILLIHAAANLNNTANERASERATSETKNF